VHLRTQMGAYALRFTCYIIILALLFGCASGAALPPAQALAEVRAAQENMAHSHAVWDVTLASGPIQGPFLVEVWRGEPDRLRIEVLEAPTPALRRLLLVRNGERAWLYDQARQRVEWGPPEQARLPLLQDALATVDELLATAGEAQVVSARRERSADGELTRAELSYPGGTQATLWLDPARRVLRRIAYRGEVVGQAELAARTVEAAPHLPDELFTFDPPAGVQAVRLGGYTPRQLTLEEASRAAGFPLLLPDVLPPGTALVAAYQLEDVIALSYSGTVTFTLAQGPGLELTLPLSRSVPLRSTQAQLSVSAPGEEVTLLWLEGGIPRSLAGTLSAEEALRLAESLR
jgi:outer membrane lipoprotein-sorting protein